VTKLKSKKGNKKKRVNLQTLKRYLSRIEKIDHSDILERYRSPIILFLIGSIFIGTGLLSNKSKNIFNSTDVEILETSADTDLGGEIVVEVAGAVESPGVFKMPMDSRIEDVLIASGGLSEDADREWVEKYINRAEKLMDGKKIYIPRVGKHSEESSANNYQEGDSVILDTTGDVEKRININSASVSELESLWGIGPVYAQKVIDHRPYSSVEELLSKKVIKKNVYERNKDILTVY
jgi:competence protein ComEA